MSRFFRKTFWVEVKWYVWGTLKIISGHMSPPKIFSSVIVLRARRERITCHASLEGGTKFEENVAANHIDRPLMYYSRLNWSGVQTFDSGRKTSDDAAWPALKFSSGGTVSKPYTIILYAINNIIVFTRTQRIDIYTFKIAYYATADGSVRVVASCRPRSARISSILVLYTFLIFLKLISTHYAL